MAIAMSTTRTTMKATAAAFTTVCHPAIRTDSDARRAAPAAARIACATCWRLQLSQGLEWAIECGDVHDAATAQRWIEDHLTLVMARF